MNFEKYLNILCVPAFEAESIGILFMEIGAMVEKLFLRVFFTKKSPVAT
jgi:hypothetical protein